MLYICLPSHNEATTVGVLLWRIRAVFAEFSREYEVLVYDDASTDATRETLEPYTKVMPLTVIGSQERVGYAAAVDALLREASARTRYPRRDAAVLMQADFTDLPEHLPDLVKRFEGGADVVLCERAVDPTMPLPERRRVAWLRRISALWPFRRFIAVPGIPDPFSAYRIVRLATVRELLKARDGRPAADIPVPAANAELTRDLIRHARKAETLLVTSRWDLRQRESRIHPWQDAVAVIRRAWSTRHSDPPPRPRES